MPLTLSWAGFRQIILRFIPTDFFEQTLTLVQSSVFIDRVVLRYMRVALHLQYVNNRNKLQLIQTI